MSALKTLIYGQAKKFGHRSTSLLKIASDTRLRRISEIDENGLILLFSALHNYPTITEYMGMKIHNLLVEIVIQNKKNKVIVVKQGESFNVKVTFSTGATYPDMVLVVKDEEIVESEQPALSTRRTKDPNVASMDFVVPAFPYTSNSIRFLNIYVEPEEFTGLNVTSLYPFCVVVTNNTSLL
jgi:hypothetical protein